MPRHVLPTTPDLAHRITVAPMTTAEEAKAFRDLNEEWITAMFTLEEHDRELLGDPDGQITARGGSVLIARTDCEVVGCVALIPTGRGVFELSKMAVSPALRGHGIGRKIIFAAIDQARALGATSLFLGSSTKLANAVHLYESVGFRHVPRDRIGPMPYERADVFMEYDLGPDTRLRSAQRTSVITRDNSRADLEPNDPARPATEPDRFPLSRTTPLHRQASRLRGHRTGLDACLAPKVNDARRSLTRMS